ncbi:hypothetical protein ACFOSV_11580 [Algoriphagus namhaensis]|uniref:Long-chain fatty acid transport protein n=1 Tax=Algoriphagus namhaensis TaxID=915353 RepID=A0ABV8AU71_9BACT
MKSSFGIIRLNFSLNKIILLAGLSVFFFQVAWSQDTHHWSNQFGTRAALLGGAVLTDTVDNAGVYYNPANLAFLDTSSLSINANLYGLENIEIQNALGQKQNFQGLQLNTVPLLISGTLRNKSDWNLSYALITPVSFKFNGLARIDQNIDIIKEEDSPGLEDLVAESGLNTRVQETSVVFGLGKRLNPNFGFGFSLINTFRNVEYNYRFSAKTFANVDPPFLISRSQNEFVNYWSLRSAIKAGLNYQKASYGLALTVQSPGINWMGNGEIAEDITITNLRLSEDGDRLTGFGSARQEKLKSNYKSPFQLSIGGHKQFNNSIISLNITHFGGVDTYRIIEAQPGDFIRPASLASDDLNPENFLNVETAMRAVTNFALGYETRLNSGLKLLGSFRTDFSYYDSGPTLGEQITTELTQWDIYHFTLGSVFEKDRSSLTLGLVGSFGGTSSYIQENSFSSNGQPSDLEGALTITQAKYSNIGLLIGYSFRFKKFN